jgi:hypothetical protein
MCRPFVWWSRGPGRLNKDAPRFIALRRRRRGPGTRPSLAAHTPRHHIRGTSRWCARRSMSMAGDRRARGRRAGGLPGNAWAADDKIADTGHSFGPRYRASSGRTTRLDPARAALIAGYRLVRDPVLPHAWSVFHCVATPRIPVHHAQEPPIGGKLPSYFLLKSLTQSFPLEWRDVLRYHRLRKLHTAHSAPRKCCCGTPT